MGEPEAISGGCACELVVSDREDVAEAALRGSAGARRTDSTVSEDRPSGEKIQQRPNRGRPAAGGGRPFLPARLMDVHPPAPVGPRREACRVRKSAPEDVVFLGPGNLKLLVVGQGSRREARPKTSDTSSRPPMGLSAGANGHRPRKVAARDDGPARFGEPVRARPSRLKVVRQTSTRIVNPGLRRKPAEDRAWCREEKRDVDR